MPTTFVRTRESTENILAGRRVRDVSRKINYLNPDSNPFTLILREGGSRKVTNSKFEWQEKGLAPKLDQVNNGGGYASGATAIVVDNAAYFNVGNAVKVPRTQEVMLVTAVNTGSQTLTVVRGVGSTTAAALVDNDDLIIIGSSHPEGGPLSAEKSHLETQAYNYTQIFKDSFGVTGTQDVSENYTGKDKTRLRMEKGVEHKLDIERAFLFGERAISTTGGDSTDKPRRYTGGFVYWAANNIKDAGGTLTEPELEDWLEDVFAHTAGSGRRLLMASPQVMSTLDMLAASRIQTAPKEETMGVAIKEWMTSHGSLMITKHRLLESGAGGQGYGGWALAVETDRLAYATLPGRDTTLREDVGTPGDDAWTDEYLTECGLEFKNPELHGVLKNVTG